VQPLHNQCVVKCGVRERHPTRPRLGRETGPAVADQISMGSPSTPSCSVLSLDPGIFTASFSGPLVAAVVVARRVELQRPSALWGCGGCGAHTGGYLRPHSGLALPFGAELATWNLEQAPHCMDRRR
jgi:hypothetical protein